MRDGNTLEEKSKGETKEGAKELLTLGDLQSHRKMFNLIKNTYPEITVSTATFCKSERCFAVILFTLFDRNIFPTIIILTI